MKRVFALILCALFVVALAACGEDKPRERPAAGSDTSSDSSNLTDSSVYTGAPIATLAPAVTEAPSYVSSGKSFATVEEYIASPTIQSTIDELRTSAEGVMDIDVYADGNCLVYDYQYTFTMDASTLGTAKSALDSSLDSTASTFEEVARDVQEDVDEPNVCVKVIYRNGDGSIITQRTFYQ